ncbi:AAA family ATPase [Martelella mangrovi]|uniref:Adenylate kinase family enzyme n=1 Tax=Martelella mangrovi TaxID=1397477 RepID=A0ABV2IDK8_9HYPH
MNRIFIMGNGGSCKSWLAKQLAAKLGFPITNLDDLHWLPGFVGERPRHERDQLAAKAASCDSWIIEGIYGSVLKQVFSRVTTLIWLDLADDECIPNLVQRGQNDGGTSEQFQQLLEYTRTYRLRKKHLNSFDAHRFFYDQHPKQKFRLSSRTEINDFLVGIQ